MASTASTGKEWERILALLKRILEITIPIFSFFLLFQQARLVSIQRTLRILCTASRPWTTTRRLVDLIDGPEMLLRLSPSWEPLFWELCQHDPQRLLNSEEAFLQVLAVIRLEEAEQAEFELIFRAALQRLEALHGKDKVRWSDLLRMLMTWATWRRPIDERKDWWTMAETIQTDATRQREVKELRRSLGHVIFDEGRNEGRVEGRVDALREMIFRLGQKRFGPATPEAEVELNAIVSLERLQRMSEQLLEVGSWAELLASA
jgi:hypothetical protein